MLNKMIDPVVQDYLFANSRLKSPVARMILGAIVAVMIVIAILGWIDITSNKSFFEVWLWVPYTIIGSILGYLVISFLDRERRVRFFHFFVIASVMLVAGPMAAFFNDRSPIMRVTVGFFEEGVKILPVLLLALYIPNLIRTRKDGIVYGALAGMGFNIIEIGAYLAAQVHTNTILESLYMHSTRLGIWGFGSHIIWSAFAGLGIGLAAESTKTGWEKWKFAVLYYLVVAIAHSLYDIVFVGLGTVAIAYIETLITGADFQTAMAAGGSAPGPVRDGMTYVHYVYNIVLIVALFRQTRRSFSDENTIQVEELSAEEHSVVTQAELEKVKRERLFFKRKYDDLPNTVSKKVVLYQNLLAMQKRTAAQHKLPDNQVEPIGVLRGAIRSLRGNVVERIRAAQV